MKQSPRIAAFIFLSVARSSINHYFPPFCCLLTQLHLTFSDSQNAALSRSEVPEKNMWISPFAAAGVSALPNEAHSTMKTSPANVNPQPATDPNPETLEFERPKTQQKQRQYRPTQGPRENHSVEKTPVIQPSSGRNLQIRNAHSWVPKQNVDKAIPSVLSNLGWMAQSAAALLKSTTECGVSAMKQTDTFKSLRQFLDDRDIPSRQQFASMTRNIGNGIVEFLFRVDITAPEVREKLLELYAVQLRSSNVSIISKYEHVPALDDCGTAFFHLEEIQTALVSMRAQATQEQIKQMTVAPDTREHFLVEGTASPQQQPSMNMTSAVHGGNVHVGTGTVDATQQNHGVRDSVTENTSGKTDMKMETEHLATKQKILREEGRADGLRGVSVKLPPTKGLSASGKRVLPKTLYVLSSKLVKDLEVELSKHVSYISNGVMEVVYSIEALKLYVRRMLPRLKKVIITAWDFIETSNLLPDDQRYRLWILADFIWDLRELDEVLIESSNSIPFLTPPYNPMTYYYGTPSVTRAEVQAE